jgi:hypothetical protein
MYHSHSKTERQVGQAMRVLQFSTRIAAMTNSPLDLRRHSQQTKKRLVIGGLALTFVLGTVLIAVTYGTPAAGCGLGFFAVALIPVALIFLVLSILQWIADRSQEHKP